MRGTIFVLLLVVSFGGSAVAQNLLVNGSFDEPAGTPCQQQNGVTVPGWNALSKLNGDLYIPACPRDGDGSHASVQGWGEPDAPIRFYQAVENADPGTTYTFEGLWWIGNMDASGNTTARAELRDGPSPDSPLIGFAEQIKRGAGDTGQWLAFSTNGEPTGTQVTVVVAVDHQGATGWALHCDACVLTEAVCADPPAIASIEPAWGARGNPVAVTITGANFAAGATTAVLSRANESDVPATDVEVAGTGDSMTCTFDLTDALIGRWNLVILVEDGGCADAVLPTGFLVVRKGLSNGSFELPDPVNAGCEDGAANDAAGDWLVSEVAGYGWAYAFYRDEIAENPPTCPAPEGSHYASSRSDHSGGAAEARIYQTVVVESGTDYTAAAYFAGAGANIVTLELLDGDESAPVFAAATANSGGGAYDWALVSATGTPSTAIMTVQWRIALDGSGPHVSHADAFVVSTDGVTANLFVGDANCDGQVNIADAICLLTYLFGQGGDGCKTPCCAAGEDANNDATLNIADAIMVLSYLFGGDSMVGPDGDAILAGAAGCRSYAPEDITLPCDTPCTP